MRTPQGGAAIRQRRLACIGFDWRAQLSLRATLSLLAGKTQDHWDFCEDLSADAIVYEAGNALAQALARREHPEPRRQLLFPCSADGDGGQEPALRYPFGASRLIRCLDHASEQLAAVPAETSLGDSLAQRLDEALATPGVIGVALLTGERRGLLLPAEAALRWPLALNLDETVRLLAPEVQLQVFRQADMVALNRLRLLTPQQHPWGAALWTIGTATSGGRLLRRLDPARYYRLKQWPEFGHGGRRTSDTVCANALMHRALSPEQLALAAGLPLPLANNFLNAAALCGLLQEGGVASDKGGMLQRLRSTLAGSS